MNLYVSVKSLLSDNSNLEYLWFLAMIFTLF
jgi:hypothetical protein